MDFTPQHAHPFSVADAATLDVGTIVAGEYQTKDFSRAMIISSCTVHVADQDSRAASSEPHPTDPTNSKRKANSPEITRLQNSLAHLATSQSELLSFLAEEEDADLRAAWKENEGVM